MIKELEEVRKQVSAAYDCEMREARVHLVQALATLDSILNQDEVDLVERVVEAIYNQDKLVLTSFGRDGNPIYHTITWRELTSRVDIKKGTISRERFKFDFCFSAAKDALRALGLMKAEEL
jgi:hypothetical protein